MYVNHEHEYEDEYEAEQFFGGLASLASRALGSPALRQLALQAARSVIDGEGAVDGEGEADGELALELSLEGEINPVRKIYVDAMMEHLGHVAAEAESEAEAAEAFAPLALLAMKALPLVGRLALRAAPRLIQGALRVMPRLTRGITQIARTLHRNPQARQLLRVVPEVARRTTAVIGKNLAAGRSVTPRMAAGILARQTANVLGNPRHAVRAWQRSRHLDGQHHRAHPHAKRQPRHLHHQHAHHGHAVHHHGHAGHAPPPILTAPHPAPTTCSCGQPLPPPTCAACGR